MTIAKLRQEIDRLRAEVAEKTKRISREVDEKWIALREIDRLKGRIGDLTQERDYLRWASDEHLAALDEEGLAEIYEVEVPNDDEVVSYAPKTR